MIVFIELIWIILTEEIQQNIICRLADGRIVCQDFVAKPGGIPIGQFRPDTVQKRLFIVIEDVIVPDKCGLANRLYNASLPSFAIYHQSLPSAAGVGMAGDERQQVTPRLDFDFVHLVRLDDLHINHGIGECFP